MKNLIIAIGLLFIPVCYGQKPTKKTTEKAETNKVMKQNIYQFKVVDIEGNVFDFATLKGKKIMVVNTASECGLTPQYEQLQKIYSTYKELGFEIVAFPANNFGAQEPGSNNQIKTFCSMNYGVTFPMMAKISVKGDDMHPLYQFLTDRVKNGFEDSQVEWNFQKYLINEKGELVNVISPKVLPDNQEIIDWITK